MCIAAAKFLVGRLSGLYPESAGHLNVFLRSAQAKNLAPKVNMQRLMALWGHPEHAFDTDVVNDFNTLVLPALIEWGGESRGSVRSSSSLSEIAQPTRATHFCGSRCRSSSGFTIPTRNIEGLDATTTTSRS